MGLPQKNILINHFQAVEDYLKLDARNGKHLRFIELMKNRYIPEVQNLLEIWLDTGTHESLVDATNFVKTMEQHQHRKIACLEEIAYLNGWITKDDVLAVYEVLKKNQYGQYLKDVVDGKYLDVLH